MKPVVRALNWRDWAHENTPPSVHIPVSEVISRLTRHGFRTFCPDDHDGSNINRRNLPQDLDCHLRGLGFLNPVFPIYVLDPDHVCWMGLEIQELLVHFTPKPANQSETVVMEPQMAKHPHTGYRISLTGNIETQVLETLGIVPRNVIAPQRVVSWNVIHWAFEEEAYRDVQRLVSELPPGFEKREAVLSALAM